MTYHIRAIEPRDHDAVAAQIRQHWTLTELGYIDQLVDAYGLPGFVAEEGGQVIAALTWRECEGMYQVFTLISDVEGRGIGSALLKRAEQDAAERGYGRVLISTENSYIDALIFYQKRGYVLHRVHINAMEGLRKLKPSIPEVDTNGIPIRDQIDLVKDMPARMTCAA